MKEIVILVLQNIVQASKLNAKSSNRRTWGEKMKTRGDVKSETQTMGPEILTLKTLTGDQG